MFTYLLLRRAGAANSDSEYMCASRVVLKCVLHSFVCYP